VNRAPTPEILARDLRRRLRAARVRLLVHGLVSWLAVGGGALVVAVLTLGHTEPPLWMRWGTALVAALIVMLGAWRLVVRPLRRLRSTEALVLRLEAEARGRFANTLTAAEEALRRPDRWQAADPVRAELVRRLLTRARTAVADLDLPRLLPLARPGSALIAAALVAGLAIWQQDRDPEAWHRGWSQLTVPWQGSERTPERPRLVAGSIPPTNRTASLSPDVERPGFRNISFQELAASYTEQVRGLLDGGAQILLVETIFDTLNARAALVAIRHELRRRQTEVPIWISARPNDNNIVV